MKINEDLRDFFNLPEFYKKLTAAMIQDAARTYLDTNNYVQVTLFPEKQKLSDILEDLWMLFRQPSLAWQP